MHSTEAMRALAHRSPVKLTWTLAAIMIASVLAPAVARASFPGGNGIIAYTAEGKIWALDPETEGGRPLTSGPNDSAPSFSPSGNTLAFQRVAGGTVTVYLAGADGSDVRSLVEGSEPAFSPNGSQIVFVRADGLFVTGVASGSAVERITHHPGDREPQWSSRGSIAFERTDTRRVRHHGRLGRRVTSELDLIAPPRGHVRQILTYEASTDMWPTWSPNGKTLTVALCKPLPPHEREGEPELPKLEYLESCGSSAWAPEGHWTLAGGHPYAELGQVAIVERRLAEIPEGAFMAQHVGAACPSTWGGVNVGIAWQPLLAGTMRVVTSPCDYRGTVTGVAPSKVDNHEAQPHRTRSCSVRHHQHCRR